MAGFKERLYKLMLKAIGSGKVYDFFVLPEPKEGSKSLYDMSFDVPYFSRTTPGEAASYYANLAKELEKAGYGSHAELLRFVGSKLEQ